ncbi:uncharacterized protein LOC144543034 [Centroberyx gerrardi]
MELLWVIFPVFLICVEAEKPTEVQAALGDDATFNCSLQVGDIYWYMQLDGQLRLHILRSFNQKTDIATYCDNYKFETKYAVLTGNRFMIKNVTADDYRIYFCAQKKNGSLRFGDSFRLVSVLGVSALCWKRMTFTSDPGATREPERTTGDPALHPVNPPPPHPLLQLLALGCIYCKA